MMSAMPVITRPAKFGTIAIGIVSGAGVGLCLGWGQYLTAITFALIAVGNLTWPLLCRQAYSRGWLSGRQAMLTSMAEATRRNMSFPDWIEAEMERDGFYITKIEKIEIDGDE